MTSPHQPFAPFQPDQSVRTQGTACRPSSMPFLVRVFQPILGPNHRILRKVPLLLLRPSSPVVKARNGRGYERVPQNLRWVFTGTFWNTCSPDPFFLPAIMGFTCSRTGPIQGFVVYACTVYGRTCAQSDSCQDSDSSQAEGYGSALLVTLGALKRDLPSHGSSLAGSVGMVVRCLSVQ